MALHCWSVPAGGKPGKCQKGHWVKCVAPPENCANKVMPVDSGLNCKVPVGAVTLKHKHCSLHVAKQKPPQYMAQMYWVSPLKVLDFKYKIREKILTSWGIWWGKCVRICRTYMANIWQWKIQDNKGNEQLYNISEPHSQTRLFTYSESRREKPTKQEQIVQSISGDVFRVEIRDITIFRSWINLPQTLHKAKS